MKKIFLLITILAVFLSARDDLYFLPNDSNKLKKETLALIENANSSIKIAMYNFSHKKILKALKKARKRGLDVKVFYEKSDIELKSINPRKTKRKLHTKLAIIDDKIVLFGSSNWTKKSFKDNYEVVYITDNDSLVEEFVEFFNGLE